MACPSERNTVANIELHVEKLKTPEAREAVSTATLIEVIDLYTSSLDRLEFLDGPSILLMTNAARFIRNACAGCKKNQDVLHRKPECFKKLRDSLRYFFYEWRSNGSERVCDFAKLVTHLKCSLQMVGNSTVQHPENGKLVWATFYDSFVELLQVEDPGLYSCCCMVIHSCILANPAAHIAHMMKTDREEGPSLMSSLIFFNMNRRNNEWLVSIIEKLFSHPNLLPRCFDQGQDDMEHRFLLIEVLLVGLERSTVTVALENIMFVSMALKREVLSDHFSLDLTRPVDDRLYVGFECEKSLLTLKLLAVIATVTSDPKRYPELLNDKDLVKCGIKLLKTTPLTDPAYDDDFPPLANGSDPSALQENHPANCMKRDTLRLLANMTYRHKTNQDLVRELGGIPLIMDNMKIDSINPLITQWSVFAVRNLLDGNPDNQALVSGMRLSGLADNVDKLRELGVEAELKDGKVIVKGVRDMERPPFAR